MHFKNSHHCDAFESPYVYDMTTQSSHSLIVHNENPPLLALLRIVPTLSAYLCEVCSNRGNGCSLVGFILIPIATHNMRKERSRSRNKISASASNASHCVISSTTLPPSTQQDTSPPYLATLLLQWRTGTASYPILSHPVPFHPIPLPSPTKPRALPAYNAAIQYVATQARSPTSPNLAC